MWCLWALLLLCPDDHCHRELPITDAAWWTMLPRRRADTPVSLAAETLPRSPAWTSKEWGRRETSGSWTEDLSVILPTRRSSPHLPRPPYATVPHLLFIQPVEIWGWSVMLSLILRCWIVPLPFTWIHIYILTDTEGDPHSPPEATERP